MLNPRFDRLVFFVPRNISPGNIERNCVVPVAVTKHHPTRPGVVRCRDARGAFRWVEEERLYLTAAGAWRIVAYEMQQQAIAAVDAVTYAQAQIERAESADGETEQSPTAAR